MVIAREPQLYCGLRRDYTPTPTETAKAYLLGALQDGTERKTTWRISQKCKDYLFVIKQIIIKELNAKAWIYKEGSSRNVWVLEFSKSILDKEKPITKQEKIAFIRGFWDADGGIAKNRKVKFYIYFAQKNKEILLKLKRWLNALNIKTGKLHNPSKRVDPNYWRFYISTQSHYDFVKKIGSWHPEKSNYFLRVKR
jgi:intein/homing endonuclease